MGPRRGAVDAGVASFSKAIRTSGTRSVRVVGCTRCFPTRPASVPKLDSEGPQRYRCRECGCRSVSKLAGVTRLLSDFLIPHFKLSHYLPGTVLGDRYIQDTGIFRSMGLQDSELETGLLSGGHQSRHSAK